MNKQTLFTLVVLSTTLSFFGCGSDLVSVTGTVTLDGKPLEGATVTFRPQEGESDRPSAGVTDASGKYELKYTATEKGAKKGKHRVEISTASNSEEESKPETLPTSYNVNSELTADVTSGANVIDFKLDSKAKNEPKKKTVRKSDV